MKASIIIPAFNAEKTIGKCLESVILQKPGFSFEIIVVDDGSKDKTFEVAKSFRKATVLRQKNAGPAVARNNGAKKAKADNLVFLDSDCVVSKNWLKEIINPLEKNSIAGVQGIYKNRQKELIARFVHLEIEQRYEKMAKQKFIDFSGSYSAAYKKKVFQKMNGFDESFPMASGEDTDFSFRVSEAGYKMVLRPEAFVYHFHPTSFGKYIKTKFFRAFWRTKIYKKHKKKMVKDSYTSQTAKAQIGIFYLMVLSLALIAVGLNGMFYASTLFVLLFLSTLPFAFWAAKKDLAVGIVAPAFIIIRTIAFGTGFTFGIAKQVVKK